MTAIVKAAHIKTRCVYGAVRLHRELLAEGHDISLWKVKKIRKREGIVFTRKRKHMITTDSDHTYAVAENILDRQFKRDAPCTAWVSDITYIHTKEGFYILQVSKTFLRKRSSAIA